MVAVTAVMALVSLTPCALAWTACPNVVAVAASAVAIATGASVEAIVIMVAAAVLAIEEIATIRFRVKHCDSEQVSRGLI